MAFWGLPVHPKKESAFVPPPENTKLHISQACIVPGSSKNAHATLLVSVGEREPLAVCALKEGTPSESVALDLLLDEYTEFTVQGNASVHLTGYFMPEYELEHDDSSDDDDDDGHGHHHHHHHGPNCNHDHDHDHHHHHDVLVGYDQFGTPIFAGDIDDSDDDSDSDSDDDDYDGEFDSAEEDLLDGEYSTDSDEEDDDEEDEDDGERGVIIEDITGKEESAKNKRNTAIKALPPPETEKEPVAAKTRQQQAKEKKENEAAAKKRKADEVPEEKQPKKKDTKTQSKAAESPAAQQIPSKSKKIRKFANGFEIEDVKMGAPDGKLAKPGKKVVVQYVGRLQKTGKIFDQTKGSKTFAFRLGVGEVIKGWDRGVEGMRVGDKRRVVVPPAMGYGSSKMGPIPPNSTLEFDITLMDVKG